MREILIACGDVELLRQLLSALPAQTYKPIATKRGRGTAAKIAGRGVREAIVHESLEDDAASELLSDLSELESSPAALLLFEQQEPEGLGPYERALRYPIPAPILRHAISQLAPEAIEHDLERWRAFYRELRARRERAEQQDYYQIFGLERGAAHHVIVYAFDLASLRYHPDRYNPIRSERWGRRSMTRRRRSTR